MNWQELPKARKTGLISYILLILSTTILIILGVTQFSEYIDEMQSDVKYCIDGVFIASFGFYLFNYINTITLAERICKLKKELEKVKEKDN